MTTGVLVALTRAREGGPTALLRTEGTPLVARLAQQLRACGVSDLVVVTRAEWLEACKDALGESGVYAEVRDAQGVSSALDLIAGILASDDTGSAVIADADQLVHTGAIKGLLADPRASDGILVRGWQRWSAQWLVRVERGRVVSAESPYHRVARPNTRFLGLMQVSGERRARAAAAVRAMAGLLRDGVPPLWERELARKVERWGADFGAVRVRRFAEAGSPPVGLVEAEVPDPFVAGLSVRDTFRDAVVTRAASARDEVVPLVLTALVRAEMLMRCSYLRELYWARPLSQRAADAATAEMATVDEERVLMNSAVKAKDGFFGTFFCSPYTKHIARWCAKHGIRPNQVTVFSFALGLASAGAFAVGSRAALVTGAMLLYLTLAFDCVDGQLARYSKQFTPLGAWLDPMFDRGKEYAVYAALAFGAVRQGASARQMWMLALATLTLQTVRHMLDFTYAAGRHKIIEAAPQVPPDRPWDVPGDEFLYGLGSGVPGAVRMEVESVQSADAEADPGDDETDAVFVPPRGGARRGLAGTVGGTAVALSRRTERVPVLMWIKRIIQFPIGERYAAISFGAAIGGAKAVFAVMLGFGAFAMAYAFGGRILRSMVRWIP